MVVQSEDTVTIPVGGVPVIAAVGIADTREVVMAVNFLRCGCELVQVISGRWHSADGRWLNGEVLVRKILRLLQLPGEEFSVSSVPHEDEDEEQDVFVVRRTLIEH